MAIALVQASSTVATGTSTVSPTLPAASTAGTLLVAHLNVSNFNITSKPTGWVEVPLTGSTARSRLLYYPNNPGGLSSFTFGGGTFTLQGVVTEWSGVATTSPLDTYGETLGTASPITITTTGNVATASSLGVGSIIDNESKASTTTFTAGTGWTNQIDNSASSVAIHLMATYKLSIGSGATLSESPTNSSMNINNFQGVIAVFKPDTGGGGGGQPPDTTSFFNFF